MRILYSLSDLYGSDGALHADGGFVLACEGGLRGCKRSQSNVLRVPSFKNDSHFILRQALRLKFA
ncbi:hypothetical protein Lal_00026352 [Lupinus albus]|nr:hypothetical protein Lal_00026352 [Lupinus albus]